MIGVNENKDNLCIEFMNKQRNYFKLYKSSGQLNDKENKQNKISKCQGMNIFF